MKDNKLFAVAVATTKTSKRGLEVMTHLTVCKATSEDAAKGAYITKVLEEFPDRQISSCCVLCVDSQT